MEESIQIIKSSLPAFMGNVGILFALAWFAYTYGRNLISSNKTSSTRSNMLVGLACGAAASLVQFAPFELIPGVFVDSRGVPIMFSGIIGGPHAALIATAMGAITRYLFGGIGANAGVAFALLFGISGLVARRILTNRGQVLPGIRFAIVLGISGTIVAGFAILLLPQTLHVKVLTTLWPQLIVTNVIGSVIFTVLLQQIEINRKQSESMEMVIDSTGVGIWDWDVQTGATVFNERWANIIGYTLQEISPVSIDTWMKYAHDDDLPGSEAALKACWSGETEYYLFESRMHHKDGSLVWVYDTGKVVEWVKPGVPKRMIGTHLDITERKREQTELLEAKQMADRAVQEMAELNLTLQAEISQRKEVEKRLQQMALFDHLTNLPNRAYLKDHARRVLSEAQRENQLVAILFIDLDGFKQVNDSFGHEIGDAVLVEMSIRISDSVREMDLVARFGGDEFLVVLPKCNSREEIDTVVQRLIESAQEPIDFIKESHRVGMSIGVSVYPEDGHTFEELIACADHAMYKSKASNTSKVSYPSNS